MATIDDLRAELVDHSDDGQWDDPRALYRRAAADAAQRARRQVRRRALAAAVLAVVVVGGGALAILAVEGDPTPTRVVTRPDRDVSVGWPPSAGGWVALPAGPVDGRVFATVVWTGAEIVVWGGEAPSETTWHADGAAFDPATGTWRRLAPSPLDPRSEHAAVWTGDEMIVCCGRGPRTDAATAAAYDPARDEWRTLAPPPVPVSLASAVYRDGEMIVVGRGADYVTATGPTSLAYDVARDTWRVLPGLDTAGVTSEVVLSPGAVPTLFARGDRTDGVLGMMVLADDGWAPTCPALAGSGVWPDRPSLAPTGATGLVFPAGEELLVVGSGDPGRAEVRIANLECSHPGSTEAPVPAFDWFEGTPGSTSAVWTGREVVVWTAALDGPGGDVPTAVAFDPANGSWRTLPDGPPRAYVPDLLWVDGRVVVVADRLYALDPG